MTSGNVEKLVNEIYADSRISPAEIMRLRREVESREQRILKEEGMEGTMSALCKSFDVTNQLLQTSMLELRKSGGTEMGRAMVVAMVEANLALLKATADAFAD
jgi:hypothetical protein